MTLPKTHRDVQHCCSSAASQSRSAKGKRPWNLQADNFLWLLNWLIISVQNFTYLIICWSGFFFFLLWEKQVFSLILQAGEEVALCSPLMKGSRGCHVSSWLPTFWGNTMVSKKWWKPPINLSSRICQTEGIEGVINFVKNILRAAVTPLTAPASKPRVNWAFWSSFSCSSEPFAAALSCTPAASLGTGDWWVAKVPSSPCSLLALRAPASNQTAFG